MNSQALAHVKVLDLTEDVAGPFCTKLLADYGAQVIKIESPGGGDPTRNLAPFHGDQPHPEKSGLFIHLNANKSGITLDLECSAAPRIVQRLLDWGNVVVESFQPGTMERFGLSYSHLKTVRKDLVMTSITNFGQTGPYRDYKATEIVEYAIGGPMLSTGASDREPVKLPGRVGMFVAGQMAATATLMAAYRRDRGGTGEHLDISVMETQAGSIDRQSAQLLNHQYTGARWSRHKAGGSGLGGIFKCQDGYIEMWGWDRAPRVMDMLGTPELKEDPRFATDEARREPENTKVLGRMMSEWFAQRTKLDAWKEAQRHRVLSAPINDLTEVAADGNKRGRGFWTHIERPYVGTIEHPGRSLVMESTPWRIESAAPTLGQHNDLVYRGMLGYSSSELVQLRQSNVV
jgi:crotonobetainyl-CoA:carnitine CoA-transferase CaiB-like acyl-CoA transferase